MSSMFDSKVSERRSGIPEFCHANLLQWMKGHASEATDGENVVLTVVYRHAVASRFWYGLEFTDEQGVRRTVTASDTDLLTWRADTANTFKHPYFEENQIPKRRAWRFRLFGLRIAIER